MIISLCHQNQPCVIVYMRIHQCARFECDDNDDGSSFNYKCYFGFCVCVRFWHGRVLLCFAAENPCEFVAIDYIGFLLTFLYLFRHDDNDLKARDYLIKRAKC